MQKIGSLAVAKTMRPSGWPSAVETTRAAMGCGLITTYQEQSSKPEGVCFILGQLCCKYRGTVTDSMRPSSTHCALAGRSPRSPLKGLVSRVTVRRIARVYGIETRRGRLPGRSDDCGEVADVAR